MKIDLILAFSDLKLNMYDKMKKASSQKVLTKAHLKSIHGVNQDLQTFNPNICLT